MSEFRLASRAPLTEAELGWIDLLRAIWPDRVPPPDLASVQAFRRHIGVTAVNPRSAKS